MLFLIRKTLILKWGKNKTPKGEVESAKSSKVSSKVSNGSTNAKKVA